MQYIVDERRIYLLIGDMTKNNGPDRRKFLKTFAAAVNLAVEPGVVGKAITGELLSSSPLQQKRHELFDIVSQLIDGRNSLFETTESIFQATRIKICEAMIRDGKSSPTDIKN